MTQAVPSVLATESDSTLSSVTSATSDRRTDPPVGRGMMMRGNLTAKTTAVIMASTASRWGFMAFFFMANTSNPLGVSPL